MAAKRGRANRPGSVRQKKGRTSWEARVTLPTTGSLSRSFPTEREGWIWINRTVVDAERGRYIPDTARTTGAVFEQWVTNVAARTIKPNSLYNYRLCLGYVLPWIGDIKLTNLKRPDIERTFAGLARGDTDRGPHSANTLQLTFRVLKMSLDYCEDADYIVKNPMRRMKAPQPAEPKERVFARTQVVAMLKAMQGTRWEAAFWILATTGMRVSEVLGLEWKNIDLNTGHMRIERQTGRIYGRPGVQLVELKTRASKRDVVVPPVACDILRWHADKQRLEHKNASSVERLEDHGTVFATPERRRYFRSRLADVYRQIAEELHIEGGSLHTFRHTVVTLVQEGGHTLKDAQTLVGHATDRMTSRVYSHPSTDGMQRIADAMQLMLDGAHTPLPEDPLTNEVASWNTLMGRPMGQTVPTTT